MGGSAEQGKENRLGVGHANVSDAHVYRRCDKLDPKECALTLFARRTANQTKEAICCGMQHGPCASVTMLA